MPGVSRYTSTVLVPFNGATSIFTPLKLKNIYVFQKDVEQAHHLTTSATGCGEVRKEKNRDETQCLFHTSTHSPYNTYTLTHISITDSPVEFIKEKKTEMKSFLHYERY